jgi:hypothetical protein
VRVAVVTLFVQVLSQSRGLLRMIVNWVSHLLLLLNLVVCITNPDVRSMQFWKEIELFIRIIALSKPIC